MFLRIGTVHGVRLLPEEKSRELARRLRDTDAGDTPGAFIAAAIHLERALESLPGGPEVPMNREETLALLAVIRAWLNDVGAVVVGEHVMDLRDALNAELST